MKIRQPNHIQAVYANFTVLDSKRGEVIISFCLAEGDAKAPVATVASKVVMQTANFERMVRLAQEQVEADNIRYGQDG